MIDAHCHLNDDHFLGTEIAHLVDKARQNNVWAMICNGAGKKNSEEALALANIYPEVFVAAGLGYSTRVRNLALTKEWLTTFSSHKKVVAIGECGLDFPEGTSEAEKQAQKELLAMHIEVAQKTNLPVVIHCRQAHADVMEIIPSAVAVQCHCFTGNKDQLYDCLNRGWYISFGGILTFKKSDYLREVAQLVPADRLLIETDSPYLTPEPIRKERNQPANVKIVAQCLAEVRRTSIEEVVAETTANAKRLFTKLTI